MVYFKRWPHWWVKEDTELSIIDVVNSGGLDFKLAGLLWLLIEHRASVLVAAGPSWAGKSTLLHALLDFLPPGIEKVALRGYYEDFRFTWDTKPDKAYLITEEISNHSYEYLWGHQVVRALELIPRGYALGGTIHARNIKEVAYVLNAIGAPIPLIAGLGIIITLQVLYRRSYDEEPARFVDTVSTLSLTKEGLAAQTLAMRQSASERYIYPTEPTLHDTLFSKFAVNCINVSAEIERRRQFLQKLGDKGIYSRDEVKKAIPEYYKSRE